MLGKTHMSVGIATSLFFMQPATMPALIAGTGAAAIGAVISDIDVGTSESHREANKIIGLATVTLAAVVVLESTMHLGIYERLMRHNNILKILMGSGAFLLLCAYGKETAHRTFMHSLLATLLLSACVEAAFPLVMPYFAIGMLSHLFIDLLNKKKVMLFFPFDGCSFNLCSSKGTVNNLLYVIGNVCSVVQFVWLGWQILK